MAYTTINKSSEYFNTKLYTGNGTTNAITGVGFQPDLIWSKNRGSVTNHFLVDVIRGTEQELRTNSSNHSAGDGALMDSFDSDGFTLSTSASMNTSSANYVAWNWKANGAGVSNTDGDITSTVSASTTSGFSIVSFNGQTGTVGHGLGVKPSMIILKCRAVSNNWVIQHKGLTGGMDENALIFTTSAEIGAVTAEPTNSVFTVNNQIAENNDNIAYCFAEKKGFSKFGSYVSNANVDGTFVYTGMKPAFIIVKNKSATGNWFMLDNKRNTYNVVNSRLTAEGNFAEDTGSNYDTDFLSNGFKLRTSSNPNDSAGNTYIYMAFAEEPLVGTNGVPATAR
jgi:hypothetical protein